MPLHEDSAQLSLPSLAADSLQDALRVLTFGSPKHKEAAIELYGADHINQSYSRLSKALSPEGGTFLDPNKILPLLEVLGPKAKFEFAWWLIDQLGLEPKGKGKLGWKSAEPITDQLDAITERLRRDEASRTEAVRELARIRELLEETSAKGRGK